MNYEFLYTIIAKFFFILKYSVMIYISILDMKKKIISEKGVLVLLFVGFIEAVTNHNIEGYYIGICVYSMPLLVLYILEDYLKKELIGFGDVKLMMGIGGLLRYKTIKEILKFYRTMYFFSGIVSIFLIVYFKYKKIKSEYIPFAPFIISSYILMNII